MKQLFVLALAAASITAAAPAAADVDSQSDVGFAVKHQAEVKASPEAVWEALAAPNRWWDPQYSFTGNPENFFLDMQAGGCFCERIRQAKGGKIENSGSVQHMQVVYVEPPKVLRMTGALGPLQAEGVSGTLSIGLKPVGGGTQITFEYVVGGYMRYPIKEIASAVDAVIGRQLSRLAKLLDGNAKTDAPVEKASAKASVKKDEPEKSAIKKTDADEG
ncbi:SRPBCC family protein [Novosphingopyxis sp.]|uniref:SRPBCC family protein n=1 Tax=Novosphingopyxis sp. TaxID=2709690 RepID=UPI003B5C3D84